MRGSHRCTRIWYPTFASDNRRRPELIFARLHFLSRARAQTNLSPDSYVSRLVQWFLQPGECRLGSAAGSGIRIEGAQVRRVFATECVLVLRLPPARCARAVVSDVPWCGSFS